MVVALSIGVPYVLATLVAFILILLTRQVPFLEAFKGIAWERFLAISAYMISYGVKNSGLGILLFPWVEPFSQGFALFTLLCFGAVTLLTFLFPSIIAIALLFPIAEQIVQGTPMSSFFPSTNFSLPFILAELFPFSLASFLYTLAHPSLFEKEKGREAFSDDFVALDSHFPLRNRLISTKVSFLWK